MPIGRPIGNTTSYILDRWRQPVPIGVAGELYLGGAGVARGYLNRPELTAERFVANTFDPSWSLLDTAPAISAGVPAARSNSWAGLDHQVKIRGFRIEASEIEAALERVAGVCQAIVVVRKSTTDDHSLIAYVVQSTAKSMDSMYRPCATSSTRSCRIT